MSKPTTETPSALRLLRLTVILTATAIWLSWSGDAVAADIKNAHSIACEAKAVHGFRDVQAAKSWDVNEQLPDPNLVFEWRPNTSEGTFIEVDGLKAQLVSITDNSVVAISRKESDPNTVRRWLFAINFRLEDVVGVNVESNVVSMKGRVAEFSCSFGATH